MLVAPNASEPFVVVIIPISGNGDSKVHSQAKISLHFLLACSLPLFAARAKKPLEMCCGILDAVEDCFKFVVAVACCLVLGGPALIIAGSVLLSQDDGRKAYNEAVKEFDPAPINAWTGTINGVPTNVVRKALNVHGASGATSVFAEAVIPVRDPSSTLPVSVNVATVAPFTRYAFFKIRKR
ncbi:surface glycoprotein, partial [Trypanosoma conorhini]